MKVTETKKIVYNNEKRLRKMLGLSDWDVTYSFVEIDPDNDDFVSAACLANQPYKKADIIINPTAFNTKKEVLKILQHELVHCLTAPLASGAVYEDILSKYVSDREMEVLKLLFKNINEEITNNFCRVLKQP